MVLLVDATYYMWYEGFDDIAWRIGLATSQDGLSWTKRGLVLDAGPLYWFNGNQYRMWYEGDQYRDWRIGYAVEDTTWEDVFIDVTRMAGVEGPWEAGAASGDFNNDSYGDFYVSYRLGSNALFMNNGNGTFTNRAEEAGVAFHGNSQGISRADFNNDGYLDLDNDGDLDVYVINTWGSPEYLFVNDGNGRFTSRLTGSGLPVSPSANTTIFGDYDQDGDLDLFVTTHLAGAKLYNNRGNDNNWLIVNLAGVMSNRSGIGAKVHLFTDGVRQFHEVSGGFGSFGGLPVHFGLGRAQRVDSLIIAWPSGIVQSMIDMTPNQILTIREGALAHDVAAYRIVSPKTSAVGDTVTPEVMVKNLGVSMEEGFTVTCHVDSSGTIVYADTQSVAVLMSLDATKVAFAPWFPAKGTEYTIQFATHLLGDLNPRNDVLTRRVTSLLDHDIAMLRIIWPPSYIYEYGIVPVASIKNNGRQMESLFDVTCEIHDAEGLVYRGTQTVIEIAPLDTLRIYFGLWEPEGYGPFTLKFFSRLAEDQNRNNDTLAIVFSPFPDAVPVEASRTLPKVFFLSAGFPNPFNDDTRIEYHVPEACDLSVEIYDLLGHRVRILADGWHEPGVRVVSWDARNEYGNKVASGICMVRMKAARFEQICKMTYLK